MDNVIWLIDDDASVRESLVFLLTGMHWHVEPYESIAAFMAAHGAEQALTGCLLLDMRMPGKGGLAWLEEGVALAAAAGDPDDRSWHDRCLSAGVS